MYAIYYDRIKVLAVNDSHQLGLTTLPATGCRVKKFHSAKDAINYLRKMGMDDMLRVQRLSIAPYPPSARLRTRKNPTSSKAARAEYMYADEEGGKDSPFSHFAGFEGA